MSERVNRIPKPTEQRPVNRGGAVQAEVVFQGECPVHGPEVVIETQGGTLKQQIETAGSLVEEVYSQHREKAEAAERRIALREGKTFGQGLEQVWMAAIR